MILVGLGLEDGPGLTSCNNQRGCSIVVFQLGRVAENNLLATSEVLREVESQSILLPVISGTNKPQAGGPIIKSKGKS